MQAQAKDVQGHAQSAGGPWSAMMAVTVAGKGYEGYVVIDSLVDNRSAGGVRIADDLPIDEVRELAREMTLKFSLFHLPRGGAKSGVRMSADLQGEARLAALRDFGAKLAPLLLNGIYNPGMDMNCGPAELRAIYQGAGIDLGAVTDTSWFTALTVFHCLQACVSTLQITGRPVTLAIDGFGSVARHLAERLPAEQFRIVAVSTIAGAVQSVSGYEPADLARRRVAEGDPFVLQLAGDRIERGSLLAVEADIALPSARTRVITRELAAQMRARAVVPIANAPYDDGALAVLSGKGTLCLPGYLSNSGGVLASSLYDQGIPKDQVEALLSEHFRPIADGILRVAALKRQSAVEVAAALAQLHLPARSRPRARSLARRIHDRFVKPRLPRAWRAQTARRVYVANSRSVRHELEQWEQS